MGLFDGLLGVGSSAPIQWSKSPSPCPLPAGGERLARAAQAQSFGRLRRRMRAASHPDYNLWLHFARNASL